MHHRVLLNFLLLPPSLRHLPKPFLYTACSCREKRGSFRVSVSLSAMSSTTAPLLPSTLSSSFPTLPRTSATPSPLLELTPSRRLESLLVLTRSGALELTRYVPSLTQAVFRTHRCDISCVRQDKFLSDCRNSCEDAHALFRKLMHQVRVECTEPPYVCHQIHHVAGIRAHAAVK
jgi:hypothetical protein